MSSAIDFFPTPSDGWNSDDEYDPFAEPSDPAGSSGTPARAASFAVPFDEEEYDPFEEPTTAITPSVGNYDEEYDPFADETAPSPRVANLASRPSVAFEEGSNQPPVGSDGLSDGLWDPTTSFDSIEVYDLRREGRYAEALSLARLGYRRQPGNSRIIKALFWTLHSLYKMSAGDDREAFRREMLALPELPKDELYTKIRRELEDDVQQILKQAWSLSEQGQFTEARRLLKESLQHNPGEPRLERALGWTIVKHLKRRAEENRLSKEDLRDDLKALLRLKTIQDPFLNRCILQLVLERHKSGKLSEAGYFLMHWNLEGRLQPEDFRSTTYNGKTIPSLAERALGCIRKCVEDVEDAENEPNLVAWAVDLAQRLVDRIEGGEWAPYHLAKILAKADRGEQGRPMLLPIVSKKAHEAWAWHALAETYPDGSTERLALLARGSLCHAKDEGLKSGALREYAGALLSAGYAGEARWVLERLVKIRREKHWPTGDIEEKLDRPPLAAVQAVDAVPLSRELAKGAEALLWEGLPTVRGWLASAPYRNKEGKERRSIQLEGPNGSKVAVSQAQLGSLWGSPTGTPLDVVLRNEGTHPIVCQVRSAEGALWEGYPAERAVLSDQNRAKRLAVFRLASGRVATRTYSDSPELESEPLGSFWLLRTVAGPEEKAPLRVLGLERSSDETDTPQWRFFEGALTYGPEEYGEVGGVHVPENVMGEVDAYRWYGCRVRGLALRNDQKGARRRWRALKLWLDEAEGTEFAAQAS